MKPVAELSPAETAVFLAIKTIAAATAFLDGRSDAAALATAADQLCVETLAAPHAPDCIPITDPTRLLVFTMMRTAVATGPRQMRWRCIMIAFVDLVRTEHVAMREARRAAS